MQLRPGGDSAGRVGAFVETSDGVLPGMGAAETTRGRVLSMRKVAQRALEHDDEEVRRLANQLLAEPDRSAITRHRR